MPSTFPVLEPESPQAQAMYDLLVEVTVISAVIFVIVTGLIAAAIVLGRKRRNPPRQDFGSHKAEIGWMVGPTIIVLWIAAISAKLVLTIDAAPKAHPPRDPTKEPDLVVVGHQWWWEVRHVAAGVTEANEIHIPVGRPLRVKLESADVIHCFWVPQLARKMDVIPGRDNYVWLEASRPGTYQGRCAEFCGTQHAWMNFTVSALEADEYAQWQAGQQAAAGASVEPQAAAGQQLFFAHTCVNCHAVAGTAARARIGPDLTHVGKRAALGGGVIANSTDNLAQWLKNPQAIKPGCKMPNFKLTDVQVRQLVAYLESLQ